MVTTYRADQPDCRSPGFVSRKRQKSPPSLRWLGTTSTLRPRVRKNLWRACDSRWLKQTSRGHLSSRRPGHWATTFLIMHEHGMGPLSP